MVFGLAASLRPTVRAADTATPWASRGGWSGEVALPAVVVGRLRRAADAIVRQQKCCRGVRERHMAYVISKHGRWRNLPYEIRLLLMRNHLLALHQRRVVPKDALALAERYAAHTGKYPWELLYWQYDGEVGAAVGLCEWTCDLREREYTLPGIDGFFASPNLRGAEQRKKEFLANLCGRIGGKGVVVEVGRVHNLFEEQRVRQVVTSDGIHKIKARLRAKMGSAAEKGEQVAFITLTTATFYDPFDKGEMYLIDPGLVVGNDVLKGLVEGGFSVESVIIATSLDGVERLACCGGVLREMIYGIWDKEAAMYEEYGAKTVELLEYETTDSWILGIEWPYDYAKHTWEEYGEWISRKEDGPTVLRRSLSLMRRSRLAPAPLRLNVFVF